MGQKGSRILSGIGKVGSSILSGLNTGREWISKGYNVAKNIPVIGNIVSSLAETPIPYVGLSAKDLGGFASKGLDVANDVANAIRDIQKPRRDQPLSALPNPPRQPSRRLPLPPLPNK